VVSTALSHIVADDPVPLPMVAIEAASGSDSEICFPARHHPSIQCVEALYFLAHFAIFS